VTFKHLTLEDGLSQISINCILQDAQGFMWFGTQDGLNKYDGHDFTVYKPIPGENSLGANFITALYQDQAGMLWVGTEGGGLDRFDRNAGRFVHYRSDPSDPHSLSNNYVRSIVPGEKNRLWIATLGGLNQFDPETGRFLHYHHLPADPQSLGSDSVGCLCRGRDGSVWVGTSAGLNRLDPDTGTVTHYRPYPHGLGGDIVQAIYEDRYDTLWVGTDSGLNRFDSQTERFTLYQPIPGGGSSGANSVRAISQDTLGALWVGTESGLNRFDPELRRFTRYVARPDDPDSLSDDFILSVYEDAEGSLWVGTYGGGLNRAHPSMASFLHYESDAADPYGLAGNHIWSIYEDHRGTLWVGLAGDGLDRLDPGAEGFVHYQPSFDDGRSWRQPQPLGGLSDGRIRAILEDDQGRLWLGTGNGLNAFNPETERITIYFHDPSDPHTLSHNDIREIYQDSQGQLWIGTFGGGLNQMDPDTGHVVRYPDGAGSTSLSNPFIWSIIEDQGGALWIGTGGGGLNRLEPEQGRVSRYFSDPDDPHALSNNSVLVVHVDRQGTVWAGTAGGGLNRFDRQSETFKAYRERDGLPNDVVYGILEDNQGNLWLSTNRGLSCFDPQAETFRNYDVGDGLQSNEFNAGAYHQNAEGRMFFGGINGLNAFYPEDIQRNDYVPPVVLTGLTQGGENIASQGAAECMEAITLDWPNTYFEFEFAALSYVRPAKNAYAYLLEGFDSQWVHAGQRRFGRYTNLPAGTYTLRVRGSNNDGVWNEQGALLKVRVVPPFWGTLWFRAGLLVLLIGAAAAGYGLRIRGMQIRSRELKAEVATRTRELEAVNTIAAVVSRSLNLDHLLTDALDETLAVMGTEAGGIYLLDNGGDVLRLAIQRGFSPDLVTEIDALAVGEGFSGRVARSGEALVVRDVSEDPRLTRMAVKHEGLRSLVVVPLKAKGQVLGTLFTVTRGYRSFTDRDEALLASIGQQIGVAVENAALYEDTRSRLAQLTALQETTTAVASTLELERLLRLIIQQAVDLLQAAGGILNLVDWEAWEDEVVAATGSATPSLGRRGSLDASLSGWAALHKQPTMANDVRRDDRIDGPGLTWLEQRTEKPIRNAAVAPMLVKDQAVGTLAILDKEGGEANIEQSDLDLLQSFANQAATAIENARLFEAEQRRAEQFRVISEVGQHTTSILSIDALLDEMVFLIQNSFNYDIVEIGLVEDDELVFKAGLDRGLESPIRGSRVLVGEEGITGYVAATGEPLLVPDVSQDERFVQFTDAAAASRSELAVPIRAKQRVIGVLNVQSAQLAAFDESDLAVMQALADQAATAIENARLFEAEQRRAEQFRVISEVGRRITSIMSIDSVLKQVVELIQSALDYDHVHIGLIEGDHVTYKVGAGPLWDDPDFQFEPARLRVGQNGITGWVAARGEPLLVPDVSKEPRYVWMRGSQTRSEVTVPVKAKGQVIGVLDVQSNRLDAFDESDMSVLQSLADQTAIAIENARLYEQAQRLAVVEERQRLARELHDSVTQALYGTTLYAEAAARQLAIGQAELASEHLQELRDTAQEALREMRLLIFELRPSVLESDGLVNALRARLEAVEERAGLEVRFRVQGQATIPSQIEQGLYRIAQEALNNALKHACASSLGVYLDHNEEAVVLEVIDDGCGFDPVTAIPGGGLGLDGMIERAAQLGGELVLDSKLGVGTRVRVEIPQ
jgi:GAF domain-containing protein/ligand-binding sensor domain-containing protein